MFAVCVTFQIHPGHADAFVSRVTDNARTSRAAEPGCQVFDICRDGNTVFLYEIYDDRAGFDAHMSTAHFLAFDAAVAEMVASKDVRSYSEVIR